MKCPNCNETLLIAERHNVEIDYCPNCRGVWLDRGELDKILDYSERVGGGTTTEMPPDTGSYENRKQYPSHEHDPYYRKKKKKGYLSDFFDFD